MNSVLEINGKKLHSIKDAMQVVSYSRDHLTRLAREKKIFATLIGKQWYVDLDSLRNYSEAAHLEQLVRTERLSAERKRALKIKQSLEVAEQRRAARARQAKSSARVAVATFCTIGVLSGVWLHGYGINHFATVLQSLNTTDATTVMIATTEEETPVLFNEHSIVNYDDDGVVMRSRSFASAQTGVFLIPTVATSTDPTALISDSVAVVETPTGQAFVRVDANGVPFGSEIPFVIVPLPTNDVTP